MSARRKFRDTSVDAIIVEGGVVSVMDSGKVIVNFKFSDGQQLRLAFLAEGLAVLHDAMGKALDVAKARQSKAN